MITFTALTDIACKYISVRTCREAWTNTVYADVYDLSKLELRISFMEKCRNASVVPKSLGNDRKLLLTRISEMHRQKQ